VPTSAPLAHGPHTFLWADSRTNLWVPCDNFGLLRQQGDQWIRLSVMEGRSTGNATCMFEDREGTIWIGTDGQGLHRWEHRSVRHYPEFQTSIGAAARVVTVDKDGQVWCGGDSGAVRMGDGEVVRIGRSEGLRSPEVRSIANEPTGAAWLGTKAGLFRYEHGQLSGFGFPGAWFNTKIHALLATKERERGSLWVGTVNGLHCLDLEKLRQHRAVGTNGLSLIDASCERNRAQLAVFDQTDICALVQDRHGAIWVAAKDRGLAKVTDLGVEWVPTEKGETNHTHYAICEDASGNVWVGGTAGLWVVRDSKLLPVSQSASAIPRLIYGIAEDRLGCLWIAGERSLVRISTARLLKVADGHQFPLESKLIVESDGLLSEELSGVTSFPTLAKGRDGLVWIATANGLAAADPVALGVNWPSIHPTVDNVTAENRLLVDDGLIEMQDPGPSQKVRKALLAGTVPPGQNSQSTVLRLQGDEAGRVAFRFGSGSLLVRQGVQYRYRLAGLDKNWIEAGDRKEAYYHHLKPGSYAFELAARHLAGPWIAASVSPQVKVVALWHQRRSVWVGLSLAVVGIVLWLVRRRFHAQLRLRALEWQNRNLREREVMVRRLHDELGPEITSMGLAAGIAQASGGMPDELKPVLSRLSRNVDVAKSVMGKLMATASSPGPAPTLDALLNNLVEDVSSLVEQSSWQRSIDVPAVIPLLVVPPAVSENLLPTVKEIVINALKHSGGSRFRLLVSFRQNSLLLSLEDDGSGFEEGSRSIGGSGGRGLRHVRERCSLMKARVQMDSQRGRGTKWALTIPLLPVGIGTHDA
jgi:ligand-binding sensor domain-containing protein/signal transduction histidine kinase